MYRDLPQWLRIRDRINNGGANVSQISRETGICRRTISKMLAQPAPSPLKLKERAYPKLEPFRSVITDILKENETRPISARRSIRYIFNLISKIGFSGSYGGVRNFVNKNVNRKECIWENAYDQMAGLNRNESIRYLQFLANADPPIISKIQTIKFFKEAGLISGRQRIQMERAKIRIEAFNWMRSILQRNYSADTLRTIFSEIPNAEILLKHLYDGRLSDRNRSMAVLSHHHKISLVTICKFLYINPETFLNYIQDYKKGGEDLLYAKTRRGRRKYEDEDIKQLVFKILHEPPSCYGINRTSWKMEDLKRVLQEEGQPISISVIQKITGMAGYRWIKARTVLTSSDPDYKLKLNNIHTILSSLNGNEVFFSIDEFGPFAVKMRPGCSLTAPGQQRVVPQSQKSRGLLIVTAALELSTNQVTHFYSEKKNTTEIIKLIEMLVQKYASRKKIYLSWDAAPWHLSGLLKDRIQKFNEASANTGGPLVEIAPLPSNAQFLNVIESVFSGMSRSIIHNSNYPNVDEAKAAIDRYFLERNGHFLSFPKKAGNKIWGKEREPAKFSEANNCKDPRFR